MSKEWLDRVTGGASVNAAAQKAQVPQKTLDTQLRSASGLKPDMVVRIAKAYGKSPVAALVDNGLLLTAEDLGFEADLTESDHLAWLRDEERATDDVLLTEIGRRLEARKRGTIGFNEVDSES